MAEAADQVQNEFWRAPAPQAAIRSATCRCGTEFIVSAVYCHVCGISRPDLSVPVPLQVPGLAEITSLGERLGLTMPAVVAFIVGILCLLAALAVSAFFSVRTLVDWQAIQMWRIEWLLASIASFVVGCLLKK